MIAILTDKHNSAAIIAAEIGAVQKCKEYFECDDYLVTWISECPVIPAMVADERRNEPTADGNIPVSKRFRYIIRRKSTPDGMATDKRAVRRLKIIDDVLERCDSIIVATNSVGEGIYTFRLIYDYLGYTKPFRLLQISSLTENNISIGLDNLSSDNYCDSVYEAADCRAKADLMVHFNTSRALSLTADAAHIGRLHIPILAMICSRYRAYRRFVSVPYWHLNVSLEHNGSLVKFRYPRKITTQQEAEKLFKHIAEYPQATITKVGRKRSFLPQPLPYDSATLMQECCRTTGISAKEVLETAISLYEKRLISDPRTDGRYISSETMKRMPSILRQLLGTDEFAADRGKIDIDRLPRHCVNDEKAKGRHAIIVTGIEPKDLNDTEHIVYDIIARRMSDAFVTRCKVEYISAEVVIAGLPFHSQTQRIVLPAKRNAKEAATSSVTDEFFEKGSTTTVAGHGIGKCHTMPTPLYTEATLLEELENIGNDSINTPKRKPQSAKVIGTAEIRAGIIADLFEQGYIERSGKAIIPTERGLHLYGKVKGMRIADINIAAEHELLLSKVRRNEMSPKDFMKIIEQHTEQCVNEIVRRKMTT
jgi:exc protein